MERPQNALTPLSLLERAAADFHQQLDAHMRWPIGDLARFNAQKTQDCIASQRKQKLLQAASMLSFALCIGMPLLILRTGQIATGLACMAALAAAGRHCLAASRRAEAQKNKANRAAQISAKALGLRGKEIQALHERSLIQESCPTSSPGAGKPGKARL